jgi:hypothetical protein
VIGSAVACPYCYETFMPRQIMFRCHTRTSRLGKSCALRPDPVLEKRRGARGEFGPVFHPASRAGGRTNIATCPDCGGETTYRICPVCHSQLPAQFGMISSRMIGMAGAKDSGKTVYMTVLLHELRNRVGAQYDVSVMGADDETLRRFTSQYEDELYKRKQLFRATQRPAQRDGLVDPLVFRFNADPGGLRGGRPQPTLMSFFDNAGEVWLTQEDTDVDSRYLGCSDGILLLLDPLQMAGARELAAAGTPLPGSGQRYASPEAVLTRVTNMLRSRNKGGRGRIDTPIAVVFTKIDALWHTFDVSSPLRSAPPTGGRFSTGDSLDVHEEVRHLLHSWEGSQIDRILQADYPRHRFFGVSALGRAPTLDNAVAASGIQPYRVADPVLWLLSEFGAVARTKEGR